MGEEKITMKLQNAFVLKVVGIMIVINLSMGDEHYGPPEHHYEPPKHHYEPPKDHYEPPKHHYEPPKDHYEPPKDHYEPPEHHYEPPKEHHEVSEPHYDSPHHEKDEKKCVDISTWSELKFKKRSKTRFAVMLHQYIALFYRILN